MDIKEIQKLGKQRDNLIALLNSRLEGTVSEAQKSLLKAFIDNFVDKLKKDENGRIENSAYNQNLLLTVDKFYAGFAKENNVLVLESLLNGVDQVLNFNKGYYSALSPETKLTEIDNRAVKNVRNWLGIDGDKAKANGYLDTLISNDTVRNQIKDFSVRAVYGRKGWDQLKKETSDFIQGKDKESLGAFQKYYRNYTYDLISQVDRATAQTYANDLKFEFAIYEGGLIDTSRPFCKERNGQVFHISEILKFDPPTAKPPNYDPLTDCGGYGCRHHYNWIPDALAVMMRPDAQKFIDARSGKKPEPASEQKPAEKPKEVEAPKIKKDIAFDDIEVMPIERVDNPKEWKEFEGTFQKVESETEKMKTIHKEMFDLDKLIKKAATQSEKTELINKYNEKVKDFNLSLSEKNKLLNSIQDDNIAEFNRLIDLIPAKNENIKVNFKGNHPQAEKAVEFFKKIASKYELREDYNFVVEGGRASYSAVSNTVTVSTRDSMGTLLHEFAHSLEGNNYVLKQAVEFLNRRTAKSKLLKLKSINKAYRSDEVYKNGGFFNPYVGKIYKANSSTTRNYKGLKATEVISMGLQQMYENPVRFKIQDREHYELIYNLFFK